MINETFVMCITHWREVPDAHRKRLWSAHQRKRGGVPLLPSEVKLFREIVSALAEPGKENP